MDLPAQDVAVGLGSRPESGRDEGLRVQRRTSRVLIIAAVAVTAVAFFDIVTPLGIAIPALYAVAVIISFRARIRTTTIMLAIAVSLLTIIGFWVSPPSVVAWKGALNRGLALFIIWTTTVIGLEALKLQTERERLIQEREDALNRALSAVLPLCAWCHRIRAENGEWEPLETYITSTTTTLISHGMCPSCYERIETMTGAPPWKATGEG